jgi:hypothetical protein
MSSLYDTIESDTMILHLFHLLIAVHIAFGAVGLVSFWVPVLGKKGDKAHRKWGKVFWFCILVAGSVAIGLSLLTLIDPIGTHPHLKFEASFIRGIFGVMMFYLAIWRGTALKRSRTNAITQPIARG